jgi:hypothetical protein
MQEENTYNIIDGTYYHMSTLPEVISILEHSRQTRTRIVIEYGNINTGEAWKDATPNRGFVGRTLGPVKIPILIRTSRSWGGEGILDHCIIEIRKSLGGRVLYKL